MAVAAALLDAGADRSRFVRAIGSTDSVVDERRQMDEIKATEERSDVSFSNRRAFTHDLTAAEREWFARAGRRRSVVLDVTAGELFTADDSERIVRAIAETKALDPAVGSGAFPMGILHKLTLALNRLDRDNDLWRGVQREIAAKRAAAAFDTADQRERDAELREISDTFERYRGTDFGRKLYLIQNSIYGVDIQPVATQIAKLRFFISLAIEQQPNGDPSDNYGIRPLPNLETRFVAADTLLALEKPAQLALGQTGEVQRLESELAANRERYFHANNRQAKADCRDRDKELRQQLAAALQSAGFPAASASQVAGWDAFDQNADAANWFDPEYMFGAADGFDVVIANPPYVVIKNQQLRELYKRRRIWKDKYLRAVHPARLAACRQRGTTCLH